MIIDSVMKRASTLGAGVLDFILPPRCAACGVRILDHGHLCGDCWRTLSPIAPPVCEGCGIPFDTPIDDGALCGGCLKDRPAFDWARAAVTYEGLGRELVLKLKHGAAGAVVPVMAAMMAAAVGPDRQVDMIIPVPLHRWRLLARRFNQSQLLASGLEARLGVPCRPLVLRRVRATASQGGKTKKGRIRNVSGAFAVSPTDRDSLAGKSILLVDDVHTTGATASACAATLKAAGAADVGVVAFARVGGPVSG